MGLEFRRDVWEQKAWEMAGQRKALNKQRVEGAGPVWNQRGSFRRRPRSAGQMLLRERER